METVLKCEDHSQRERCASEDVEFELIAPRYAKEEKYEDKPLRIEILPEQLAMEPTLMKCDWRGKTDRAATGGVKVVGPHWLSDTGGAWSSGATVVGPDLRGYTCEAMTAGVIAVGL